MIDMVVDLIDIIFDFMDISFCGLLVLDSVTTRLDAPTWRQVAGARVGGGKKEEKEEGRTKDPD